MNADKLSEWVKRKTTALHARYLRSRTAAVFRCRRAPGGATAYVTLPRGQGGPAMKNSKNGNEKVSPTEVSRLAMHPLSAAELSAGGKKLRDKVPHDTHGIWKRPSDRPNPLDILHASDAGRVAQLLPIRYGRMLQPPFTFYRGSAAVMAADLATT